MLRCVLFFAKFWFALQMFVFLDVVCFGREFGCRLSRCPPRQIQFSQISFFGIVLVVTCCVSLVCCVVCFHVVCSRRGFSCRSLLLSAQHVLSCFLVFAKASVQFCPRKRLACFVFGKRHGQRTAILGLAVVARCAFPLSSFCFLHSGCLLCFLMSVTVSSCKHLMLVFASFQLLFWGATRPALRGTINSFGGVKPRQ